METRDRRSAESASGLWFVVTCHVAARPPCPVHPHFRRAAIALALLAVLLAFPAPVSAADDETSAEPVSLPPVVVTPTRLPTPENEVGSSITVITSEEIERKQERTLPDALQDVPGPQCRPNRRARRNDLGLHPRRQLEPDQGLHRRHRRDRSGDRHFNFEHILTWDIERVEIVRGPQSGLYGADAIGGVVNIITKKGSGPAQFGGSIEGGSFGTFNQNGGVRGSLDRFNYYFDFAHFHSSDTPVTPSDLVPPGRQRRAMPTTTRHCRPGSALILQTISISAWLPAISIRRCSSPATTFLGPESLKSTEARPAAVHPRDGASGIVRRRLRSNRRARLYEIRSARFRPEPAECRAELFQRRPA